MRDWLICGHVALDKCNVSSRATSKQLLPPRKQNSGFELASLYGFFSRLFKDYRIQKKRKIHSRQQQMLRKSFRQVFKF